MIFKAISVNRQANCLRAGLPTHQTSQGKAWSKQLSLSSAPALEKQQSKSPKRYFMARCKKGQLCQRKNPDVSGAQLWRWRDLLNLKLLQKSPWNYSLSQILCLESKFLKSLKWDNYQSVDGCVNLDSIKPIELRVAVWKGKLIF